MSEHCRSFVSPMDGSGVRVRYRLPHDKFRGNGAPKTPMEEPMSTDPSTDDVVAEAENLVLVQKAIELGTHQGVPEGEGVLVGITTGAGRLVAHLTPEDAEAFQGPRFTEPELAAVWMTAGDREDAFALTELANALSNWSRLSRHPDADLEDLRKLGDHLAASIGGIAQANPFDDAGEW